MSKKATQTAFDTISTHLLTQKRKAHEADEHTCLYRHEISSGRTLKCAVGVLIPDDLYKEEFEGFQVDQLFDKFKELRNHFRGVDTNLLLACQNVHDATFIEPNQWEDELKKVAVKFNLKWKHGELS